MPDLFDVLRRRRTPRRPTQVRRNPAHSPSGDFLIRLRAFVGCKRLLGRLLAGALL
jgi:hypothetical protein